MDCGVSCDGVGLPLAQLLVLLLLLLLLLLSLLLLLQCVRLWMSWDGSKLGGEACSCSTAPRLEQVCRLRTMQVETVQGWFTKVQSAVVMHLLSMPAYWV
jgi:hypothetical protein